MQSIGKPFILRFFGAILLVCAVIGLAGCGKSYSRDEFKGMVLNKTAADVKNALGEPSWVDEGHPPTWTYYKRSYDGSDQKADAKAILKFSTDSSNQDRVSDVEFQSS